MLVLFTILCALSAVVNSAATPKNIFEGTFTTTLDHFRAQDNRTVTFVRGSLFVIPNHVNYLKFIKKKPTDLSCKFGTLFSWWTILHKH